MQQDPLGYLRRVEAGETLLVVRNERPVAEIKPVPEIGRRPRPIGLCEGEFHVPGDFDEPLPDSVLKKQTGLVSPSVATS